MKLTLTTIGVLLLVAGLTTEAVATVALVSYPIRRRLPSPYALSSLGGATFFAGTIIVVVANSWE